MLHLIHRLLVQPNKSRAHSFSKAFVDCGGIETLLVLLQKEAKAGDICNAEPKTKTDENESAGVIKKSCEDHKELIEENESTVHEKDQGQHLNGSSNSTVPTSVTIERTKTFSKNPFLQNVGGITFAISAENATHYVDNTDQGDRIIVGIIMLLGALKSSGHLSCASCDPSDVTSNVPNIELQDVGGSMPSDKATLLLFAIQKAFEAAPTRLMTCNVYKALLTVSVR